MKILFVTQYYYPERFVTSEIAEAFVSYGHEVTVLTSKPNYGYVDSEHKYANINHEIINSVSIYRVDSVARTNKKLSIIKNYLTFWKNSKRFIKNFSGDFDLVYTFSLSPVTSLAAGNLYKRKHNVPHIGHIVDLWPESVLATKYTRKFSFLYPILWLWSRSLYKKLDTILVGSPSYIEYFRRVLKIKNHPIYHVNQPALLSNRDEKHLFDKSFFNVVYSGNISSLQLVNLFGEAFAQCDKKIKFHIIGNGSYFDHLEMDIAERKLQDNVILYGNKSIEESIAFIEGADAVIVSLSSKGYVGKTIPNKLSVAMAYKKPIISILQGDGRAILNQTKGAVIAEEFPISIAKAINNIASYPDNLLNDMVERNFEYYKNNLSLNVIVEKVIEVFKATLKMKQ